METNGNVNISLDNLVFGPGYSLHEYPNGIQSLTDDQLIDYFQQAISFWILRYAKQLAADSDAGFAILLLVNSYPDLIAQLHNIDTSHIPSKIRQLEHFTQGMLLVFPELRESTQYVDICKHLYSYSRNALAHMGLTGKNVILANIPGVLASESYNGEYAIVINPRLWAERISQHFEHYMSQLRDKNNIELRQTFVARVRRSM